MQEGSSIDIAPPSTRVYRFLHFELDLAAGELRRGDEKLGLSRQQLTLLGTLVRAQGQTVSRETLLREVWGPVVVSEGALRQAMWELRKLLAPDDEKIVETVRGRGYRLIPHVNAGAPAAKARASGHVRLLGRERELAELEQMREDALQRGGRACVLLGPAGVGKSRLAREILERAQTDGIVCSASYADSAGALPPLWPWTQLLETCLHDANDALRNRCRSLAPGVFAWLEAGRFDARAWPLQEPAERKLALFEQLSRALVALLRDQPRVCLLEDFQWADEASLAFLAHHARALAQSRALWILTCRSADGAEIPALARALEALGQEPHNQCLQLSNLGLSEVAAMLAPQPNDSAAESLAAQVHALTGGNPLFVLELSRALAERTVQRQDLELQVHASALQPVIERRLRRLPGTVRLTLQVAAVLGRDFAQVELAAILEHAPRDVSTRIDECLQSGILVEAGEHRFAFAHPLLQQGAYALLSYGERSRLHELVARWLESLEDAAGPRRVSELAHHFYLAAGSGQQRKAIDYARKAAETALRAAAYGVAAAHLQRALHCAELLAECPPAEHIALALAHVEALHAERGSNDEIRAAYLELIDRARTASLWDLHARAALGYAGHQHLRFVPARFAAAVDPREVQILEQALSALGPTASQLRVLTLCSLAYALTGTGEVARCRRLMQEALSQATTLSDTPLLARVLSFQIYVGTGPRQLAGALATCDALVELTLQHGLQELELEARIARYLLLFGRADRAGAERDAERAEFLAQTLGTERSRGRARLPAFIDAFGTGQLRSAERLADELRDAAPDDANQQQIWFLRFASAQMLSGSADLTRTVAGYEYLLSVNPYAVNLRAVLSSAYATLGRHDDARREFDALAADAFAALPHDMNWLPTMAMLADAAMHLRDAERARPVYEQLLPHADAFFFFGVEVVPAGAVAMWLGDLAVVLGDLERAHIWFDRAQSIHQTLGMTLLDQYCALGRARLLMASRSAEASRAARALVSQVRHFAQERGIAWLTQCADDFDAKLAASSASARDYAVHRASEPHPRRDN